MSKILHRFLSLAVVGLSTTPALSLADTAPVTVSFLPLPNSQQVQDLRMKVVTDLKVTPRPGASEEELQKLHSKVGSVKMPMTVSMQLRQHLQTGAADAQLRIPVTARIESPQMELRNGNGDLLPGAPARDMAGMQFSALLVDGRYENIQWSGTNAPQMPPELLEKTFRKTFDALARFNGAQIRVGESIEVPVDLNLPLISTPADGNAGQVKARYTLSKVEAGVAFFDVAASLDLKMDLPMPPPAASAAASAEGAPPPRPQTLVMNGSGTGQLQLRMADRVPLRNDLSMDIQMQMPLPEGHAMHMNLQMQVNTEGRSVSAAKTKGTAPKAKAASASKTGKTPA